MATPGNEVYPKPVAENGSSDDCTNRHLMEGDTLTEQLSNQSTSHKDPNDFTSSGIGEQVNIQVKSPSQVEENTVAQQVAPPGKTLSSPSDQANYDTQTEQCSKLPEAVSGEGDTTSTRIAAFKGENQTLMSIGEHKRSVKRLESENKSLQEQKNLEAKLYQDMNESHGELHDKHIVTQESKSTMCDEVNRLTKENIKMSKDLKQIKEEKHVYERRTSVLADDLRKASERIEDLKDENVGLRNTVDNLSRTLTKETGKREELERKVSRLDEMMNKYKQ